MWFLFNNKIYSKFEKWFYILDIKINFKTYIKKNRFYNLKFFNKLKTL